MPVRSLHTPHDEADSSVKGVKDVCICNLCGKEMDFTLSEGGDMVTGVTCSCGNGAQFKYTDGPLSGQRHYIAVLWRHWKKVGI
jgi:hypothetical protein